MPLATPELPAAAGRLGAEPADFRVVEVPAYDPLGEGAHTFCRLWKRGLSTPDAVGLIARSVGISPGDIGTAGRKDVRAETEQTISVPGVAPDRLMALAWEDVKILSAVPHPRKLRTGHLAGNRFSLRLRGTDGDSGTRARAVLLRLQEVGALNAYGPQRFGQGGRNVAQGLRLLRGRLRRRSRWQRRFLVSALQSGLFNAYLVRRHREGALGVPLRGEILQRVGGGFFRCEDPEQDARRLAARQVVLTGPMFGPKMRPAAEGVALDLEEAVLQDAGIGRQEFSAHRRLSPGGRRPLSVWPGQVEVTEHGTESVEISFLLPPGAYATVVLREVLKRSYGEIRLA